jgi:hypothetical protein
MHQTKIIYTNFVEDLLGIIPVKLDQNLPKSFA